MDNIPKGWADEKPRSFAEQYVMILLLNMTDEERLDIISCFCRGCGRKDPSCQCWNDE